MDAAGKDSAIKHVMSGVNPQGCRVYSFRRPSEEELAHDYMWRCMSRLPESGHIGIFNRSYYEETLVVRVHRELLECEHLPPKLVGPKIWQQRFDDIRGAERYLAHNGIVTCKFFLHVSKAAQRRRFIARLEAPDKQWKFEPADLPARESGMPICMPMRRPSAIRPRPRRPGMSCRQTTNGSRASSCRRP
jgi:polyphosphate kinase 2 (PPK2 family)